jgi:crossover junction endodeoxyribonuclease RusA
MPIIEFLISRRPVSLQTRSRANLQAWKNYVASEAAKVWRGTTIATGKLELLLVYLFDLAPPDTDNIVKPIQDALVGLVFEDDALISDVESHRRSLVGTFDLTRLPALLVAGITAGQECVYVKVSTSLPLEDYL